MTQPIHADNTKVDRSTEDLNEQIQYARNPNQRSRENAEMPYFVDENNSYYSYDEQLPYSGNEELTDEEEENMEHNAYFIDEHYADEDTFDVFNPLLVEYHQRKTKGFSNKNAEYFDEENFYL